MMPENYTDSPSYVSWQFAESANCNTMQFIHCFVYQAVRDANIAFIVITTVGTPDGDILNPLFFRYFRYFILDILNPLFFHGSKFI